MLPTSPKAGTLVRFQPPDNVYSRSSLQHRYRGDVGVIYQVYNDSFAWVLFARHPLFVNSDYLYLCESPARP